MDVKAKITPIYVDKYRFYSGRLFPILSIINVILWWKQEDRVHLDCTFIVSLTLIIVIPSSIRFVGP